jgi:hypothetical protein
LVPVNVHEKLLTLPGATVCDAGTTSKLFESGSSGPISMPKNALIVSKNELSAALADAGESVNSSRPPMNAAIA